MNQVLVYEIYQLNIVKYILLNLGNVPVWGVLNDLLASL